ncbi:MAG: hypothetical protein V4647_11235, partial [Pseudomonadota bacterium]
GQHGAAQGGAQHEIEFAEHVVPVRYHGLAGWAPALPGFIAVPGKHGQGVYDELHGLVCWRMNRQRS